MIIAIWVLTAAAPPRFDQVVRERIGQGLGRHGFAGNRFARLRAAATHALARGGAIVLRSFADQADPGRARDDAALLWGAVEVIRPAGRG